MTASKCDVCGARDDGKRMFFREPDGRVLCEECARVEATMRLADRMTEKGRHDPEERFDWRDAEGVIDVREEAPPLEEDVRRMREEW